MGLLVNARLSKANRCDNANQPSPPEVCPRNARRLMAKAFGRIVMTALIKACPLVFLQSETPSIRPRREPDPILDVAPTHERCRRHVRRLILFPEQRKSEPSSIVCRVHRFDAIV